MGSNDPFAGSVTKMLYDCKNASGINIDPLQLYIEITKRERPRDICLCCGLGSHKSTQKLYLQGGGSTLKKEHVLLDDCETIDVQILPLKMICEEYISADTDISFLKVDVEGSEKEVLLGADFVKYRPKIIVMESTIPRTDVPTYKTWEPLLIDANYHFVYQRGINRYYVSDECSEMLDPKFKDMEFKIETGKNICYAVFG